MNKFNYIADQKKIVVLPFVLYRQPEKSPLAAYRSGLFNLCVLPSKESHSKFPLVATVAIKVSLASDIAI